MHISTNESMISDHDTIAPHPAAGGRKRDFITPAINRIDGMYSSKIETASHTH